MDTLFIVAIAFLALMIGLQIGLALRAKPPTPVSQDQPTTKYMGEFVVKTYGGDKPSLVKALQARGVSAGSCSTGFCVTDIIEAQFVGNRWQRSVSPELLQRIAQAASEVEGVQLREYTFGGD